MRKATFDFVRRARVYPPYSACALFEWLAEYKSVGNWFKAQRAYKAACAKQIRVFIHG